MSEQLTNLARSKLQIDNQLARLHEDFPLIPHSVQNYLTRHYQLQSRIAERYRKILSEIQEFKLELARTKQSLQACSDSKNYHIWLLKIGSLQNSQQEFKNRLDRVHSLILESQKAQKQKYQLFGAPQATVHERTNSLNRSTRLVTQTVRVGQSMLQSFAQNSNTFKKINQRLDDILGSLTISERLSQMIGQRSQQDKKILCYLSLGIVLLLIGLSVYLN